MSEGKLEISKEVFADLSNLKSQIDKVWESNDCMRGRIAALEYAVEEQQADLVKQKQEIENHEKELTDQKKDLSKCKEDLDKLRKDHDDLKQYIKFDNLLFHTWPFPRSYLSSLEFSQYMADSINRFLPNLSVPVKCEHISDAHPLKTFSNSKVIIVRFSNRNIRHQVYAQRRFLPRRMAITEHLSPANRLIVNRAKELFGKANVTTENHTTKYSLY